VIKIHIFLYLHYILNWSNKVIHREFLQKTTAFFFNTQKPRNNVLKFG